MNIPPEVARAQGKHGIKGAAHGIKGGRPKLELTDEERTERRRQQKERWRRRNGIPAKQAPLTLEQRNERRKREHSERWNQEFRKVWRRMPGETLKDHEFRQRYPAFRKWVQACQYRNAPLRCSLRS